MISSVVAHDYPTRQVRVIDPFGAGGGPDLIGRAVGQTLSELWGQPVTVENHPGAGSTAGPALVAKSPADGYTLLVNTSAHAYSAAFKASLPYDPLKDFVPIAPLTSQPYVLVAGNQVGVKTLVELTALAKARPGAITFGSSGVGTGTHLGVEKLNLETHIEAVHVPAQGPDAIADTIGHTVAGRTDYAMSPIPMALPHIREQRLAALGVSTERRSRLLPEVPTLAEAGATGFDFPIWYGIWAPAGTPAGVVHKLSVDIARALIEPDLRDWLVEHDGDPMSMVQADFTRFVLSESENAVRIIEAAEARLK
jgi:tripartite-type tricarboxylate transporter receptor subunit TctC